MVNFSEVYATYYNNVYKVAYNILKNIEDAEEVAQEVFMRIYNNMEYINNSKNISGLISTMSKNLSINRYKANKRNYSRNCSFTYEDLNMIEDSESIETHIIKQIDSMVLSKAIDSLTDKKKEVVKLFYFEGKSMKEIGEVLGCKSTTVGSRLADARTELKKNYIRLSNLHM